MWDLDDFLRECFRKKDSPEHLCAEFLVERFLKDRQATATYKELFRAACAWRGWKNRGGI
jgi:hypothetical protein